MARDRQRAKRRKAKQRKRQQPQQRDQVAAERESPVDEEAVNTEAVEAPEPMTAPEPKAPPKPMPKPKEREAGPKHGKVLTFFSEVRSELKRVQWPDRSTLAQGTAVVLVSCALAGLYLGAWDYIWSNIVKSLL